MTRSRFSWIVGLLACGALVAGCGSSGSTTASQGSSTAAATTAATTTAATTTTPATSTAPAPVTTTPGTAKSGASLQQEIAACKREISKQSSLPAKAKSKLEAVCADAARGDTAAVKQAAREVCEEVINSSAVPAGPARERALAACKVK